MMQSNRSEYSHKRKYSDRSLRQWDDYDERWEERREPHRVTPQDSYQKYGGNKCSSKERTRRSREYSDSPQMLYSQDSSNRDWSTKSSVRRRMSSPDWGTSEKKRQRYTVDDKDDYRYRREREDNKTRQSPDSFLRAHATKDHKYTQPQEEDFKYRKTPQEPRHRYRQEDYTFRQQHDDSGCRQSSGYYKERNGRERSRERSQERTRSQDCFTKSYAKPRERNYSPSADDDDDRRQNRRRAPLNGSREQSFESDVTSQEQKSAVGFQRFLNVLNKGVNVAMLTKIVTQTPPEAGNQPQSTTSFVNTDRPWSPTYAGRQQERHENPSHWDEGPRSHRPASPQPSRRSLSPRGNALSNEKSLQIGDTERSYFNSDSKSSSPSVVEKTTLTPEDEHKRKQMQDVLQAIGINLGLEELGQMSHRIQERLYGKKDNDTGRHRRGSKEWDPRQAVLPQRQQSQSSSSSRSSESPLNRGYYKSEDSFCAQQDVTEPHQVQAQEAVEYGPSEKCETYSQESTAACQPFSQSSTYTLSKPSTTSVMPVYSPVNCSPLLYPALPPVMPPGLTPNVPHFGPRLLLPRLPPFFPYPSVPPVNVLPAVLSQTRHLLPQQISTPPFVNLPGINPIQPLNTAQKSKTLLRRRCLQVIETKQPG